MALPDFPKMSVATDASFTPASSSSFCTCSASWARPCTSRLR
jgi:hypothetical protein